MQGYLNVSHLVIPCLKVVKVDGQQSNQAPTLWSYDKPFIGEILFLLLPLELTDRLVVVLMRSRYQLQFF